jgi:hypothetical protein
MKKTRILSLLLCLLIPSLAFTQNSRTRNAAADRSWQQFYTAFRSAVNNRDRVALRRLMSSERRLMSSEAAFFSGGGGETRDQWIQMIDERRAWQELQRSVASGTVPYNEARRPGRITRNRALIFQFIGGRWRFVGVMGD